MSFGQNSGGAVLEVVTRLVKGPVTTTVTTFDDKSQKNEQKEVPVETPVIVFFPNGNSQVMSLAQAEHNGFTKQPNVLNFDSVNDPNTLAGKWKFAMTDEQRRHFWVEMEKVVISICASRGGYPLDASIAKYSEESILFAPAKKGVAA